MPDQQKRHIQDRGLTFYLLIEVPSCLSVWQLLLTSDMFFESESAFFSSEYNRQQRSVRVKLNAGLYTELRLPPVITNHIIHLFLLILPFSFSGYPETNEHTSAKWAKQTCSSSAQVLQQMLWEMCGTLPPRSVVFQTFFSFMLIWLVWLFLWCQKMLEQKRLNKLVLEQISQDSS